MSRIMRLLTASSIAVLVVLGLTTPATAAAPTAAVGDARSEHRAAPKAAKAKVKVKFKKKTYAVGERPRAKVTVRGLVGGRWARAQGRLVVKALGKTTKATVRRGKATFRLPELNKSGRVKVRVTFKRGKANGRALRKQVVTKRINVETSSWNVPDEALRAEIRKALGLPEGRALTLRHARALDNAKGAALHFGDVRTAAGLELATNLTELDDFTAAHAQDSRGLDNIVRVHGDFWISNAVQEAAYPKLAHVGGAVKALNIDTERIRSLSMPALADAESIQITQRPLLAGVSMPSLANVRGGVDIDSNPALTGVALPALTTVAGNVEIGGLPSATQILLPSLADVRWLYIHSAERVTTLDLRGLTTVRSDIDISTMPALTALTAPALRQVAGSITIYGMPSITRFAMPQLQTARGRVEFGMGDDFAALPRNGSAVDFAAFDVTASTNFSWSAVGDPHPHASTPLARWQEFLTHFGIV